MTENLHQPWKRELVIVELKRIIADGGSLRFDPDRKDTSLEDAVYDVFGGWRTAFIEAGINPKTKLINYWTEEEVIKRLRQLAEREEPLNTLHLEMNHPRLWNAARRFFSNIESAIAAAGMEYSEVKKRQSWSEDKISGKICQMFERGEDISQISLMKKDSKLLAAGQKCYGSWRQAVEAAGIKYEDVKHRRRSRKASSKAVCAQA